MKTIWKRVFALLLTASMCLSISACGSKGSENRQGHTQKQQGTQNGQNTLEDQHTLLAETLEFGYTTTYQTLDIQIQAPKTFFAGNKIFLQGYYHDMESPSQSDDRLCEVNPSTGDAKLFPVPELIKEAHTSETIQTMAPCSDGSSYWVVTDRQPDELTETASSDLYTAKKFDLEGNMLQEIDLGDVAGDWFTCQAIAQDGSGYLYMVTNDGVLLCYAEDGSRQADIPLDSYIQDLVTDGNGEVLAVANTAEGNVVMTRLEGGTAAGEIRPEGIDSSGSITVYGGNDDTVLLSDSTMLHRINVTTGETAALLSWVDSDINSMNISGVAGSEDILLVVLTDTSYRTGETTLELGTLQKTNIHDIPQKTVLSLGTVELDNNLRAALVDFNRTNTNYRISLVDYSVYNTDEDYTLGAKQLEMDIVSGNCPDLIDLSGMNAANLNSKGVLANLSELLEQDETLSETDLMAGPLQAYRRDGILYGIPYAFGFETLYGSVKLLGQRESWTPKEMVEVLKGLNQDVQVMDHVTQSDFLVTILDNNLESFVDYGAASCSFASDAFKNLLRASACLPAAIEEQGDGPDVRLALQQGNILLRTDSIRDTDSVEAFLKLYIPENGIVNIGYPVDSGVGAVLNIQGGIGISNTCREKDGAWAFIRSLLTDDFQTEQWQLPVTVSAFDKVMKELQEPKYYMDYETGETVGLDSVGYIGTTEYKLGDITDADIQEFKDYINGITNVSTNSNSAILDIVMEEAAAFFAGDKTEDEVADLIQNRVNIYLSEVS